MSSSSDSDTGERVKNVRDFLIKSESNRRELRGGHSFKRRIGDLIFNADFEGGNLGYVERVDTYNYDLMVRPDVSNPRHRLWFNFTVSNQKPSQCVIFNFVNFSEDRQCFHLGLTPVVRSRMKPNWIRLSNEQVFYHKSSYHNDRKILSIAFRFISYEDEHQFALLYPYTCNNLINFITRWNIKLKRMSKKTLLLGEECMCKEVMSLAGNKRAFDVRMIGESVLSKPIYTVRLGARSEEAGLRVMVICQSLGNLGGPVSLVCQGLIDYLLSDDIISKVALKNLSFLVFPMMDPDSIAVGNSFSDIMGQSNLSTRVMKCNPNIYSNYVTVEKIIDLEIIKGRTILLDLRTSMTHIGSRIIGFWHEDCLRMDRHLAFPRHLERFAEDFYLENCVFSKPELGYQAIFDYSEKPTVDQYCLEVSSFAYFKRSLSEHKLEEYDQSKYISLGKSLVFCLLSSLRPNEATLPECVKRFLERFSAKAEDVDDLRLVETNAT